MQLQITADELSLLKDVLETELGELKEQIYKAEDHEFKAGLKHREALLLSLMQKVAGEAIPMGSADTIR
jgi:hypothetical protein